MKILINGVIEVNELFTSPEEIQKAINTLLYQKFNCNYFNGSVMAVEADKLGRLNFIDGKVEV